MHLYMNTIAEIVVLISLIVILLVITFFVKTHNINLNRGWSLIKLGFILLITGTIFGIIEDFASGSKVAYLLLEGVVCYCIGFTLITKGLIEWLPIISSAKRTQEIINFSEEQLACCVKGKEHESLKEKGDLLEGISDELKEQLENITGYIDLILSLDIPEDKRRYLKEATYSAESLDFLIKNIQLINNNSFDNIRNEKSHFNLNGITTDLIDNYHSVAKKKKIDLNLILDSRLPKTLLGDRDKIYTLISKFIESSIVNTSEGYIEIDIYPGVKVDNGIFLNIQIRDTGNPIPMNYVELIESYSSKTSQNTRLDLGTSIAYKIICQLKGSLDIEKSRFSGNEIVNISIPIRIA